VANASEDFDYCRDFRFKLEGDLILRGEDYDWLLEQTCYDEFELVISCQGTTFWTGQCSYPLDFEIDEDNCEAKVNARPVDLYTDQWDEHYEDKTTPDNDNDVIAWEADNGGATEQIQNDLWTCADQATLLRNVLDDINPDGGSSVYSFFFWNDAPYGSTENYVTEEDPNPLNHLVFILVDEIANGTGTVYPEMSWKDIFAVLHDMFQVYWWMESETRLRIEHIQYWEDEADTEFEDLTTLDGGKWLNRSSKYRYLVDQTPRVEWWYWDTDLLGTSTDWGQYRILYDVPYNPDQFITLRHDGILGTSDTGPVSTDIVAVAGTTEDEGVLILQCLDYTDYKWDDPGNNAPDGIERPTLMTVCSGGNPPDWVVWYDQGSCSAANHINAELAPANLLDYYWRRWRAFESGNITCIGDVTFDSVEPILLQTEISFPACCELLTGFDKVKTQYGSGYVYSGTYYSSGMLKVEILNVDPCADVSFTG